ncbi:MAG TPA: two-component sensor histidine kinase [Bacteroidales bacterium]|nr:MAG: hypothetical protein A2W98_10580 [Bacteroidetes bacterium GWF2_33_38]OFY70810.1 MAG: hypothetical protein A2265_04280 [Bacteroidetes bacterium RIFOXYA12_FULL_33_9]OFY90524.1 MAG: hypothetical protein A2236_05555 [Bacteroidetes bacterium RIFOXYA2_FULL_33_7]HBF87868.1 two-component sensor histidine kinase [Bacteroidales bacterium]
MKKLSPQQLAFFISLFVTSLFASIIFFICDYNQPDFWKYFLIFGLSFIAIIYLLIYYIFKKFIISRILPIYKTIYSVGSKIENFDTSFEDINVFSKVEHDVMVWNRNKSSEIEKLKEMEAFRKEYIGNISHELKTPIFSMLGYISTLIDGGLEDETINKKYLLRAEKSINRMISIINDLESITKLESNVLALERENFDITKLIEDVIENHEIFASEKNINVRLLNTKTTFVNADKSHVFILFNNLINNSIKYGNIGGETKIDLYNLGDKILFEITDNGIGIPEKHINRIFERFYRVDKSRSRDQGGTGLGLSIVKHIIEAHKQTINVKSLPEKLTTFTFTLDKAK